MKLLRADHCLTKSAMAKGGRQRSLTAIFASVNTKASHDLPAQPLAPGSPPNALSLDAKNSLREPELCSLPLYQEQAESRHSACSEAAPLCPGNHSDFSTPLLFAAPASSTAEAYGQSREVGIPETPQRQRLVSGVQNFATEAETEAASAITGDSDKPPAAALSAEAKPLLLATQVQ